MSMHVGISFSRRHRAVLLALAMLFSACTDGVTPGDGGNEPEPEPNEDAGPGPVVLGPDVLRPEALPAVVVENPTSPPLPAGGSLPWTTAPEMTGVQVVRNRDSATVLLPVIDGARDYRAFLLTDAVTLDVLGETERVLGATVYCAGYFQHNDVWSGERELIRAVEINGIPEDAVIVIEALDETCPFAGVMGNASETITPINGGIPEGELHDFYFYTKQEIIDAYGSLIINGHAGAPLIGLPADEVPAQVLARTTIRTEVDPTSEPPVATFFDGFENPAPLEFLRNANNHNRTQKGKIYQNDKWTAYTFGAERTQMFFDDGQFHSLNADWAQDIFSQNYMIPRTLGTLDDETYLHATFEVHGNPTGRRYWWFFLCGADNPGETVGADGVLTNEIINTPFFYQDDGRNPSMSLWNCINVFPRDGFPIDLAPSGDRPQTDMSVIINQGGLPERDNVVNAAPDQYNVSWIPKGWFRTMNADGTLTGPMMDDQQLMAPRARYDIYVRRDRVLFYVNGDLRLCNDFPGTPLTMAEAAVGFGQVLYHSAAERIEFFASHNDRSGQMYYRENLPFFDARTWDNMGFENGTTPPQFDEANCFVHTSE
jgi:hypothetical protein